MTWGDRAAQVPLTPLMDTAVHGGALGGGALFVWVRVRRRGGLCGCDRPAPQWVCTQAPLSLGGLCCSPGSMEEVGICTCTRVCVGSTRRVCACSCPCAAGPAWPAQACSSHAAQMCPTGVCGPGRCLLGHTQPPARPWGPGFQLSQEGTPRERGGRKRGGEPARASLRALRPGDQAGPPGGSLQAWDQGGRWTRR